jgi:hypothetical protein
VGLPQAGCLPREIQSPGSYLSLADSSQARKLYFHIAGTASRGVSYDNEDIRSQVYRPRLLSGGPTLGFTVLDDGNNLVYRNKDHSNFTLEITVVVNVRQLLRNLAR